MSKSNKLLSTWLVLLSANIFLCHGAPTSETGDESVNIIGGVPASPGEFPYIVSILNRGDSADYHACGGTLVTMSAVVTAVHCIDLFRLWEIVVVAGAYYLEEAVQGIQQVRTVSRISKYPGYSQFHHDIAVLHLTTPFIGNASVATLPLPRRNQESSGKCEIAGWGYTEENNDMSEEMRKGNITINSKSICVNIYPNYDRDYQLCAGRMNGERVSPCIGDTGGPLICSNSDGTRYFAGVTSWGNGCYNPGYPAVCMEISRYRDWLDNTINNAATTTTTTTTTTTKSPQSSYSEEVDINPVIIEKESQSIPGCGDSSSKN